MTLADYLASEAAREDVKRADRELNQCAGLAYGLPVGWLRADIVKAWRRVELEVEHEIVATAYYRHDGERYTVTDMGEGVKALRLKGVALLDIRHRVDDVMARMYCDGLLRAKYGPAALIQAEIGTLDYVFAADLPDAICRVMLASLGVAQS